jgi:hypothetical protein
MLLGGSGILKKGCTRDGSLCENGTRVCGNCSAGTLLVEVRPLLQTFLTI